jgi:aspartyl-tRNA(Asn)/glutamyl-tRNA(Gln) amidotransferase subunit C
MKVTKDVIEHVAHLGRLELDQEEVELYTKQIGDILVYMEALNALDTDNIEPTSHPVSVVCPLRDDVVVESFTTEASLQNAPQAQGSFFRVPPVIEVED